ncbi:MAG: protein TolR [Henriciella sp.]|nr:protein TolR [Henriciella sp.]
MAGVMKSGGAKRGRRAMNSEINVTPLVDVMLVLLIVFMITAPMLTKGVDVVLPKSAASALPPPAEAPLSVSIAADGRVFIQETEIGIEELTSKLFAITGEGYESKIYVRGDTDVEYGQVMNVLTRMQKAGFRNVSLVTDPKAQIEVDR